jgi:hypothetical protein
MAIDIADTEHPVAVKTRDSDSGVFKPAIALIALVIVTLAILEHRLAALVALVVFEAQAIIVTAASAIVVLDEARLSGMALVAAIHLGRAGLMVLTATARASLVLPAARVVGPSLFLAAAAAAVGANLLATLALSSVPALFGTDRRGDCQRSRAGGKHPFHHGISPS